MSNLPANFTENTRLIKTLNSLPRTSYGNLATTIHSQYNALYPSYALSLAEIEALLDAGAKSGVYTPTKFASDGSLYYIVNPYMNSSNPINQAYVNIGYLPDSSASGPGYLACGSDEALGNATGNAYAVAVSRGVGFANGGGFNGGVTGQACGSDFTTSFG